MSCATASETAGSSKGERTAGRGAPPPTARSCWMRSPRSAELRELPSGSAVEVFPWPGRSTATQRTRLPRVPMMASQSLAQPKKPCSSTTIGPLAVPCCAVSTTRKLYDPEAVSTLWTASCSAVNDSAALPLPPPTQSCCAAALRQSEICSADKLVPRGAPSPDGGAADGERQGSMASSTNHSAVPRPWKARAPASADLPVASAAAMEAIAARPTLLSKALLRTTARPSLRAAAASSLVRCTPPTTDGFTTKATTPSSHLAAAGSCSRLP
mmetsp:Transcript_37113/g.104758  ORF Transcript_37113/g.104758 Transcript_37113/m.104758 type:complete len:270 (-) Transcript_37113:3737-4546(-)